MQQGSVGFALLARGFASALFFQALLGDGIGGTCMPDLHLHCLELFGSRSWILASLTFSGGLRSAGRGFPWSAQAIAAVVNLVAAPASIAGNEVAQPEQAGAAVQRLRRKTCVARSPATDRSQTYPSARRSSP